MDGKEPWLKRPRNLAAIDTVSDTVGDIAGNIAGGFWAATWGCWIALVMVSSGWSDESSTTAEASRPNVVLIVADDLGFSDLGCYGGEIRTPQIDRLAAESTRWTNFRVNPMCVVTRTSLLTGHEHSQSDSYRRSWPLPAMMSAAGYRTAAIGKWHQPEHPQDHGFDTFYGFLEGQINNFTGSGHIIRGRDKVDLDDSWFATDAFADEAIAGIGKAIDADEPFFSYVAFNAPHTPLNITKPWVDRYQGRFEEGWETLRERRFERLRELGIIDDRYVDSPPGGDVRPWDSLPADQKALEAFRMQTYAAVVENLDHNVGRILDFLRDQNVLDNTVVIFMSDNGGDYSNGNIRTDAAVRPWEKTSIPMMSNGWARLKCTPFRFYKSSAYEGGVRVPMMLRWPTADRSSRDALGAASTDDQAMQPGELIHQQCHVTDIYATLLQLAHGDSAEEKLTRHSRPILGRSLMPILFGDEPSLTEATHPVPWAFDRTSRGLLEYPWKLLSVNEGPWQLYDLQRDPCELVDRSESNPQLVAAMSDRWLDFAKNETTMPEPWRRPLRANQHGWGYHRLMLIWPFVDCVPRCSQTDVPVDTDLSFTFSQPVRKSVKEAVVRLYRVEDPHDPVWSSPGLAVEPSTTTTVTYDDLPTLDPDTAYFVLSDPGWVHAGDRPLHGLNDGAFWLRFRTAADDTATKP